MRLLPLVVPFRGAALAGACVLTPRALQRALNVALGAVQPVLRLRPLRVQLVVRRARHVARCCAAAAAATRRPGGPGGGFGSGGSSGACDGSAARCCQLVDLVAQGVALALQLLLARDSVLARVLCAAQLRVHMLQFVARRAEGAAQAGRLRHRLRSFCRAAGGGGVGSIGVAAAERSAHAVHLRTQPRAVAAKLLRLLAHGAARRPLGVELPLGCGLLRERLCEALLHPPPQLQDTVALLAPLPLRLLACPRTLR